MTTAFNNPNLIKVINAFGGQVLRRTSVGMEFEAFLKRIRAHKRGPVCLEIGTYHGISTMILAQFFPQVIAVTIEDLNTDVDLKHRVWNLAGVRDRIKVYECKDNEHKASVIRSLNFNFCYMDGDHEHDTPDDFALVERCGRILFHEYWPLQPPVWDLVKSLPKSEVTTAQFDCFAYWERRRG